MREFAKAGFRLRQAPATVRLAYGAFLAILVPGFATQAAFQLGRVGVTPSSIAAYYRGGERGDVMIFPKTAAQLLEVTHAHAFVMALVFLVLAHLCASTAAGPRLKRAAIVAALAGTLGDLAGPWLVRYVAPPFGWLLLAAWVLEALGYGTMVCLTAWECAGPGS